MHTTRTIVKLKCRSLEQFVQNLAFSRRIMLHTHGASMKVKSLAVKTNKKLACDAKHHYQCEHEPWIQHSKKHT